MDYASVHGTERLNTLSLFQVMYLCLDAMSAIWSLNEKTLHNRVGDCYIRSVGSVYGGVCVEVVGECEVRGWIWRLLQCRHGRYTWPMRVDVSGEARCYVTCLGCGRELEYDWTEMRIVE